MELFNFQRHSLVWYCKIQIPDIQFFLLSFSEYYIVMESVITLYVFQVKDGFIPDFYSYFLD
jgi:hypothetical protein